MTDLSFVMSSLFARPISAFTPRNTFTTYTSSSPQSYTSVSRRPLRLTPIASAEASSSSQPIDNPEISYSYEDYRAFFDRETDPNDIKQLKWSDIDFKSIQEELNAIDEYQRVEEIPDDDPWPIFLRGAAYEHWGQPKLALAQYALTKGASGLRQVPEIWQRRAYNSFKVGEVVAASLHFDVASQLSGDADGNYLHILHWFYENFANYLPKHNGPPVSIQNAICKYCVGKLNEARELLVAAISTVVDDVEHALLFMMAISYRLAPDKGLSEADIKLCDIVLKQDREWDQRLGLLLLLFSTAAQKETEPQQKYYKQICDIIEAEAPHVDVITYTYMALYHDAFTRDTQKRDEYFDKVTALSGTMCPHDTENYIYHAAKNRFSIPPGGKDSISELL